VCGNDLLQSGESCEHNGPLCLGCIATAYGSCLGALYPAGFDHTACFTLTSPVQKLQCQDVMQCMAKGMFSCVQASIGPGSPGDAKKCVTPCLAQLQALAGTTDAAAINAQIADPTTLVGRVGRDAVQMYSEAQCAELYDSELDSSSGYGVYVSEVDVTQVGGDTAEFIELVNGSSAAENLTGRSLIVTAAGGGTQALNLPLSGVLGPGQYLVVGTPSVVVPFGVRKIALPMDHDNIPNDFYNVYVDYALFGAPGDPSRPADTGPGTLCFASFLQSYPPKPNGRVKLCPTPTPGEPNQFF
jgi:hypothetical protein